MMSDVSLKNNEKNTNKNISAKSHTVERSPLGGWPEDLRDFRYLGCFPCLRPKGLGVQEMNYSNLQILLWGWDALMVPTPRCLLHLNTPRKPSLDGTWQAGDHLSRESFVTVIFSFQRFVLAFSTTIDSPWPWSLQTNWVSTLDNVQRGRHDNHLTVHAKCPMACNFGKCFWKSLLLR